MKVRVTVTLDVDADAWATEYGLNLEDVRADVKEHAAHSLTGHFAALGLLNGGG